MTSHPRPMSFRNQQGFPVCPSCNSDNVTIDLMTVPQFRNAQLQVQPNNIGHLSLVLNDQFVHIKDVETAWCSCECGTQGALEVFQGRVQ